jgi:hypothetical protein
MIWRLSNRADPRARLLADRHYNRQKPGAPQFVPPGRCVVLLSRCERALFVTSWPFAEYVKHSWAGAWVNSCFRREGGGPPASDLILAAVAATRSLWEPPALGMVTFVDPAHVRPTIVRGKPVYGYCYRKAGFEHVGYTAGGLWAWQLPPERMPVPEPPFRTQGDLFDLPEDAAGVDCFCTE